MVSFVVLVLDVPDPVVVVFDVPLPDCVGTTTPSLEVLFCAIAAELPRNKDKPRPPKNRNLKVGDDINHPHTCINVGS